MNQKFLRLQLFVAANDRKAKKEQHAPYSQHCESAQDRQTDRQATNLACIPKQGNTCTGRAEVGFFLHSNHRLLNLYTRLRSAGLEQEKFLYEIERRSCPIKRSQRWKGGRTRWADRAMTILSFLYLLLSQQIVQDRWTVLRHFGSCTCFPCLLHLSHLFNYRTGPLKKKKVVLCACQTS